MLKNNKGIIFYNIILMLFLSGLLTLIVMPFIKTSYLNISTLKSHNKENQSLVKAISTIYNSYYRTLADNTANNIIIHPLGEVLYYDESNNPVKLSNYPPSSNSQAITFTITDATYLLTVKDINTTQNNYYEYFICLQFKDSLPLEIKEYLGIGLEKKVELTGNLIFNGYNNNHRCYTLTASMPEKSMIAPNEQYSPLIILKIIPIINIYTLYVDSNNTLRTLFHQGKDNTSNEPILEGIKSIQATFNNPLLDNISFLQGEIATDKNIIKFSYMRPINILNNYNFAMN